MKHRTMRVPQRPCGPFIRRLGLPLFASLMLAAMSARAGTIEQAAGREDFLLSPLSPIGQSFRAGAGTLDDAGVRLRRHGRFLATWMARCRVIPGRSEERDLSESASSTAPRLAAARFAERAAEQALSRSIPKVNVGEECHSLS